MKLNLSEKKGFVCFDKVIRVNALDGRLLYYFNNAKRKRVAFNLPKGVWLTDNNIKPLKRPLTYLAPKLPRADRHHTKQVMNFEVGHNPNKCSIDTHTGNVIIDYSIIQKDIPFVVFILFHEAGHFLYKGGTVKGELLCDCYAAKQMLRRGYNPSQINFAQEFCLSEKSHERKDGLYNFLKKVKSKE